MDQVEVIVDPTSSDGQELLPSPSVDQVQVIINLTVSDGRGPGPSPALRADLEACSSAEAFMPVPRTRTLRPPETRAKSEQHVVDLEAWLGQHIVGQANGAEAVEVTHDEA